jgi:transposase
LTCSDDFVERYRVFATGNGRKTDPVDAHSIVLVSLRTLDLVRFQPDDELVVRGMLVDRGDELGRARTQTVNRLHRLITELFPGGARKFLSAPQARALVATIKPRDIVGKTRRQLAVELIAGLETIDKKTKAADRGQRSPRTGDRPRLYGARLARDRVVRRRAAAGRRR